MTEIRPSPTPTPPARSWARTVLLLLALLVVAAFALPALGVKLPLLEFLQGKKLTRDQAGALIAKAKFQSAASRIYADDPLPQGFTLTDMGTGSRKPTDADIADLNGYIHGLHARLDPGLEKLKGWRRLGLVRIENAEPWEGRNTFGAVFEVSYKVAPSEAAARYVEGQRVVLATKGFESVTGILVTDGRATVEYSWRLEPTPFGQAVGIAPSLQTEKATLARYDDGWRVEG